MSELIRLSDDQIADAHSLGLATYERWRAVPGHYWNSESSHRKGKLGEIGVETWALRQHQIKSVQSWFRDPARERDADIRLNLMRFDVKTWDRGTWEHLGRCIRPGQVASLRRKAEGIIWCSVDEAIGTVTVAGWSSLEDVESRPVTLTGRPGRQLENLQVPVDQLRTMEDLLDAI